MDLANSLFHCTPRDFLLQSRNRLHQYAVSTWVPFPSHRAAARLLSRG